MPFHRCPNCAFALTEASPLTFGNVEINDCDEIYFEGKLLSLPKGLHDLAMALIRAEGRRLSRDYLATVLGRDIYDLSVTKYIQRIRQCFKKLNPNFDQIVSAHGFGAYQWRYCPALLHGQRPYGTPLHSEWAAATAHMRAKAA